VAASPAAGLLATATSAFLTTIGVRRNVEPGGRTVLSKTGSRREEWGRGAPRTTGGPAFRVKGGSTVRRGAALGRRRLGVAVRGAVFSATAAASSAPTPHRCDGDHDRDDVGCPPTRARVRVAPMPRPVVVMPRVTG